MSIELRANRNRKQLLAWAGHQKRAKLSAEQAAALDAIYPDWRKGNEDRWEVRFHEVVELVAALGRLPKNCSDAAESRAEKWLSHQKRLHPSNEQRRRLDAALPVGWSSKSESAWQASLGGLAEFVSHHGRMPSSTAENEEERRAGLWLLTQKAGRRLGPERRQLLNSTVPGWDASLENRWRLNLEQAVTQYSKNGRLPTGFSGDAAEISAGKWLVMQRASSSLSKDRRDLLDERLPVWDNPQDVLWHERLEYIAAFFEKNGRYPTPSTGDQEGRRAYSWLSNQRRGRGLTTEHREIMDSRLPGWRRTSRGRGAIESNPMMLHE